MIISIFNHKGGTGKTTTSINLGRALADLDFKCLLIDLDPQANLTYSLGVDMSMNSFSFKINDIISCSEGFHLLPNKKEPAFGHISFFKEYSELKQQLEEIKEEYDFILIDCPPAQSRDVANAIVASDTVIIPSLLDALSIEGFRQAVDGIESLKIQYEINTTVMGVLPIMINSRRKLSQEVIEFIQNNYKIPIFKTYIRMDVKIAEAPSHGKSVLEYAPQSRGAEDYKNLALEIKNQLN